MEAIHIVGAGGIGCAVGHALARNGAAVTFVEASPARLSWGRLHGVRVDHHPAVRASFVAFDDWTPSASALVLLCTKCYDNATVLERLPANVELVPIQNGFDPVLAGRPPHAEGIASFVSECLPGRTHTRITRAGSLHLGIRGGADETTGRRLREQIVQLRQRLRGAPFRLRLVENILPYKYSKLMYNAALCPLAAAGGLDNGDVLRLAMVRELFFALLRENHAILARAGIVLGKIGPLEPATVAGILARPWLARPLAGVFARGLRGTYCSMSADLPQGRTEIDFYNRHLIDLAGAFPCPLNQVVVALVQRMVACHLPPHLDRLEELHRAVRAGPQSPSWILRAGRFAG
jgi:2-dehydropantoate 2-reductase